VNKKLEDRLFYSANPEISILKLTRGNRIHIPSEKYVHTLKENDELPVKCDIEIWPNFRIPKPRH